MYSSSHSSCSIILLASKSYKQGNNLKHINEFFELQCFFESTYSYCATQQNMDTSSTGAKLDNFIFLPNANTLFKTSVK
jgi:hypothetical protein